MSRIVLVIFIIILPAVSSAKFTEKIRQDGVVISYKWKNKGLKNNAKEAHILKLRVENENEEQVTVNFEVLFFWKTQLSSKSALKEFCIRPGKKIKGKKWCLVIEPAPNIPAGYRDSDFLWEIDILMIEKNEECDPGLKLKLAPAYADNPCI